MSVPSLQEEADTVYREAFHQYYTNKDWNALTELVGVMYEAGQKETIQELVGKYPDSGYQSGWDDPFDHIDNTI